MTPAMPHRNRILLAELRSRLLTAGDRMYHPARENTLIHREEVLSITLWTGAKSMKTLIINAGEVRRLLPMRVCIDQMSLALQAASKNEAINPLRHAMWLPEHTGLLGMMPSALPCQSVMGIKVISVMPGNHGTAYDSHQGAVLVFETQNGRLLAIIDASETHLEAIRLVRSLRRVRVWSRNPNHAQRFAERESKTGGILIEAVPTAQEAVHNADIICTTTASPEPILFGEWIAEGTHINAVGSSTATARELDDTAVVNASLYVDRRESTVNEAGDYLFPQKAGLIDARHIRAELGEILSGLAKGRSSREEITLFKSLGLGVEDLAAANYVYQQASRTDTGTWVEFGRMRDESD
jgi:ornithine cyclodeaminase/alanine dehydrogenase-like protein (mu-crystallin family)